MKPEILLTLAGIVALASAMGPKPPESSPSLPSPPSPPAEEPPRPHKPPLLDDSGSCAVQQMHHAHVTCAADGNYTARQCSGGPRVMCRCVDTLTGIRLLTSHAVPERTKEELNCSAEVLRESTCGSLQSCDNICPNGYKQDKNECPTCTCNPMGDEKRCKTHAQLLRENCACNCIELPVGRGCPMCRENCTAAAGGNVGCNVTDCPENQLLLSTGKHGKDKCVNAVLSSGDQCGHTPPRRPGPGPAGAQDRASLGQLGGDMRPCPENYTCQQTTLEHRTCQTADQNDPCRSQGVSVGPALQCSDDGGYSPVQCDQPDKGIPGTPGTPTAPNRPSVSGLSVAAPTSSVTAPTPSPSPRPNDNPVHRRMVKPAPVQCHCVNVTDGTPIEGTNVTVGPSGQEPRCLDKSYRHCTVPGLHGPGPRKHHHPHFQVHHGQTFFDAANCRMCQCNDGDLYSLCTQSNNTCALLVPKDEPQNCTTPSGETLQHGMVMEEECEVCGCRDGRLKCTHSQRDCKPATSPGNESDACSQCQREGPPGPVCGPDGRNHISSCAAIKCAGVSPLDIRSGPCQNEDPCVEHPCSQDEVCIKKGGVACLGPKGCKPHHLRTCIKEDSLQCPTNSSEEVEGEEVCGSDGTTYPTLCHLLQTTDGVHVTYQGHCNATLCSSGPVCGSDGVTYPSVCVLRSQGVARVDYTGSCDYDQRTSLKEHCENIRTDGRCQNVTDCPNFVKPQDGCCPVCGGALTLALDQAAIAEVAELDDSLDTLDGFVSRLMEMAVLQSVVGTCELEATLTDRSDVQLTLSAVKSSQAVNCQSTSEELALAVNNVALYVNTTGREAIFPQVYEFTMAASASKSIRSTTTTDTPAAATDEPTNKMGGSALRSLPSATLLALLLVGLAFI